jgi:ketosteroid isomerase-like protein
MKSVFCFLIFTVAAATALAGADKAVEEKLKKLEQEWAQAGVKGDVSVYERIEANDFVFTDPAGEVGDKAKDLAELKAGQFKAEAIDLDDLKVRVFGKTAIITGRTTIKGGAYKGQDISGQYRFTDVWMNRGGQWQAVSSQATQIKK